jgi:hypothetical protein
VPSSPKSYDPPLPSREAKPFLQKEAPIGSRGK